MLTKLMVIKELRKIQNMQIEAREPDASDAVIGLIALLESELPVGTELDRRNLFYLDDRVQMLPISERARVIVDCYTVKSDGGKKVLAGSPDELIKDICDNFIS